MAANIFYFWPDLYETWVLKNFRGDTKSDIKNSKFKIAQLIWRFTIKSQI